MAYCPVFIYLFVFFVLGCFIDKVLGCSFSAGVKEMLNIPMGTILTLTKTAEFKCN